VDVSRTLGKMPVEIEKDGVKYRAIEAARDPLAGIPDEHRRILGDTSLPKGHKLMYLTGRAAGSGVLLKTNNSAKKKKKGRGDGDVHLRNGMYPLPARTILTTRFVKHGIFSNAATTASIFFVPSYCYDVDPTVGSTAMPFFTEMLTIYRYYRLLSSKIRVRFSNTVADSAAVYVCPTNVSQGSNASSFNAMMSNLNSKNGITGYFDSMSVCTIENHKTTDEFAGAKWNHMPDNYTGDSAGTAPVNEWFWNVGAVSTDTSFVAMSYQLDIDCEIAFFEEATPPS